MKYDLILVKRTTTQKILEKSASLQEFEIIILENLEFSQNS